MTYAYALLPISAAAHAEIKRKLEVAGYDYAVELDGTLDMHGLALEIEEGDKSEWELIRHLYTNNPILGGVIDAFLTTVSSSDADGLKLKEMLDEKLTVKHAPDCAWDKTRLTLQRTCTCGALDSGKAPVTGG